MGLLNACMKLVAFSAFKKHIELYNIFKDTTTSCRI